ncbi:MAG: phosphoribosylformylglycinamidine synthase [Phycisphaerae bacterium]
MAVFRIEVFPHSVRGPRAQGEAVAATLRAAGLSNVRSVEATRLYFLEGDISRDAAEHIASELLTNKVAERFQILDQTQCVTQDRNSSAFEIHARPGVMDPAAESVLAELRNEGHALTHVRTARRYILDCPCPTPQLIEVVRRSLANDCVEEIIPGAAEIAPSREPTSRLFAVRQVPLRSLDDNRLNELSRRAHLFLALDEMRAIQAHFRALERDPTDLELETVAQAWSEHCVHKTLKSAIRYRGAPMPSAALGSAEATASGEIELAYQNLLKDTIGRATRELMAESRGPACLSVFEDNAGVIAFNEQFGIAFKVETHNRPSAIEPYGGAATGVGGCIRDVLGCGLGARPIANTDVFCVAPPTWPAQSLPKGVLHPRRILSGIVQGVGDYGNRMGIPTVNGAVYFDPRYLGNPLVYCGCVGLIPRDRIQKAARPGDLIVLIGGRTGRDGIHGATFSSAELTDTHAEEFAHAVQIGNAIAEKRVLDAILAARDDARGCLFSAITDCGAGGLSSAVGEMGSRIGATVDLDAVPLKYAGLRYDEIWISEAQERMVLAVPPAHVDRFMQIMRAEQVEATIIGSFGTEGAARLVVRCRGVLVGDLDMRFVHEGLPRGERVAEWRPLKPRPDRPRPAARPDAERLLDRLRESLAAPAVASKEWIIRSYDHEVQGGTIIKPLSGPGSGPNDAAVLRPCCDSWRGIALACGLAPHLADIDPYWAAAAALDEAVRNAVCVGGDPKRTAVLDNFCWGRTDDPQQLGGLVRSCQACYDAARAYGTPFISGKDSLNNEFALDPADVDRVLAAMRGPGLSPRNGRHHDEQLSAAVEERVRVTGRLVIPGTLLISAVSLVDDVRRCVSADLKPGAGTVFLVGGLPATDYAFLEAVRVHHAVADAIHGGLVAACHDVSDGGWLVTLAESAIGGSCGVQIEPEAASQLNPFDDCCAAYVVQARDAASFESLLQSRGVACIRAARRIEDPEIRFGGARLSLADARRAWSA